MSSFVQNPKIFNQVQKQKEAETKFDHFTTKMMNRLPKSHKYIFSGASLTNHCSSAMLLVLYILQKKPAADKR